MVSDLDSWKKATAKDISIEDFDNELIKLRELRQAYDEAKKISNGFWEEYQQQERKVISMLETTHKKSYKVEGIGMATRKKKTTITVPKSVPEWSKLFKYIVDNHGQETLDGFLKIEGSRVTSFFNKEKDSLPIDEQRGFRLPGCGDPKEVYTLSFTKK